MKTRRPVLFFAGLDKVLAFAWGNQDPAHTMWLKRSLVVLPTLAVILGYWVTVISLITVVIRSHRQHFVNALVLSWWDLGRAIFHFWGGTVKAALTLTITILGFFRLVLTAALSFIQDVCLIPFRVIAQLSSQLLAPGLPWIAIALTLTWCLLEATIFTYVTSPLVMDTLSNMTGSDLSPAMIRAPLFAFMLFVILGSYAVLSTWSETLKSRDITSMVKIGTIEAVAMFVEVIFLYREFVDALVPWFAQHSSGNFELGVFWTLTIAGLCWFGIRGMSWFLFAQSGTPTLMGIIRGEGLPTVKDRPSVDLKDSFQICGSLVTTLKKEFHWVEEKSTVLLEAFLLPPLQVVGAALNFCTLLLNHRLLFPLPFKNLKELDTARRSLGAPSPTETANDNVISLESKSRRKAA